MTYSPPAELVERIVAQIGDTFRTFGGDRAPGNNPIAHAMQGKPLTFAASVSVEEVVRACLAASGLGEVVKCLSKFVDDYYAEERDSATLVEVRALLARLDPQK